MLEKVSLFNRYKIEIVIFIFLVFSLITRFLYVMPDMDEIWNYQFARRILYGYLPYRDYFVMVTPLSAQINASFLFLFGDELMIIKIIGLLIASIQGLILFMILRHIGNHELKSLIFICIYISLVSLYPHNNYSWYAILFLSLAMYFELHKTRILKFNRLFFIEFLIGIILGLATITKQNVGIMGLFVSIALTLYYCFTEKTYSLKIYYHGLLAKIIGWLVIIGLEITYLWQNDLLKYFYERAIQGPMIFAKESTLPYYTLLTNYNFVYTGLGLLLPLIILLLFLKFIFIKNKQFKIIKLIVLLYSLASIIMLYPLSDPTHLIFASILPIVGLSLLLTKEKDNANFEIKAVRFYPFIIVTMISFYVLGGMLNHKYNYVLDVNHYKNIHFTNNLALELKMVDNLILTEKQKGKQIYFLDYRSTFYLIPLDVFNYKSDSMLCSDLSHDVEHQILSALSEPNSKKVVLIRNKNTAPNRQEPAIFVNYVESNMNYYTSTQNFDVYTNQSNQVIFGQEE